MKREIACYICKNFYTSKKGYECKEEYDLYITGLKSYKCKHFNHRNKKEIK